jgi:hypothetical protein
MAVRTTRIKFNVMYPTSAAYVYYNHIYRATGGGTVQTTNYAGVAAFDYFDNSPSINDAVYFGITSYSSAAFAAPAKFRNIQLEVGTALNAGTLVWEYYTTAGAWATLTVGNGDAMKTTGTQTVTFSPPNDWGAVDIGPSRDNVYVRCRITNVTSVSEGGANATTIVKYGSNSIHIHSNTAETAVTWQDVYDTAVDGAWDVAPAVLQNPSKTQNSYYFNCFIEVGSYRVDNYTGWLNWGDDTVILGDNYYVWAYQSNNKIDIGTNKSDITSTTRPQLRTNQTFRQNIGVMLYAQVKAYGFSWVNLYNGAQVTSSDYQYCFEISYFGVVSGTSEFIDCYFNGFNFLSLNGNTTDGLIKNCIFTNMKGVNFPTAFSMENLKFIDCYHNYRGFDVSGSDTIYGIEFGGTYQSMAETWALTEDKYFRNPVNLPAITTTNACYWSGGYGTNTKKFIFQYSVDIKVVDKNGTAISGATVSMVPTGSNENSNNFSTTTAADGTITKQWVTHTVAVEANAAQPKSTLTAYNDFTITVSKSGYKSFIYKGPLDELWDWRIMLNKASAALNLAPELVKL